MKDKFFLLCVTLLLLLLFSECLLRIIRPVHEKPAKPSAWVIVPEQSWIEYDPKLGWFHQKNKTSQLVKDNLKIPVTTNSIGLRGLKEYPLAKPQNRFRIAAVGDSFTFGFGVRDEESFPARMEALSQNLEVMNWGIPGYGVDQMSLLIQERIVQYQPDMILIMLFPEDFWRATRAYTDAGYTKPYFTLEHDHSLKIHHLPVPRNKNFTTDPFPEIIQLSPAERFFNQSYLFRIAKRAANRIAKLMGQEDPDTGPDWILGRVILEQMIRNLQDPHIRPVLAIAPPVRWITGTTEPIRDSLLRFAARNHVEIIDLTLIFRKASEKFSIDQLYLPNDYHWTALGNELAAEEILNVLHLPRKEILHAAG